MKKLAGIGLVLVLCTAVWAQFHWPNMTTVQKIFVGKLGNNDDAERFRFQFSRELANYGFTPWDGEEGADAIVKGSFTYQNYGEKTGAQANLRLLSQDNKEIYSLSVADKKIKADHDSSLWVAKEIGKRLKEQKEKETKWMKNQR